MGRLIINNAITVNGAFEAPAPDAWLVLDVDSMSASLEQFVLADAMVLGRKTYEGLAAVWPQLGSDPALAAYAERMNAMPKYVASRTLTEPLEWNATLIKGDLDDAVPPLKARHRGNLIVSGSGELAHALTRQGVVDEFWFWVNPFIWAGGLGSSTAWGRFGSNWWRRHRTGRGSSGSATGRNRLTDPPSFAAGHQVRMERRAAGGGPRPRRDPAWCWHRRGPSRQARRYHAVEQREHRPRPS